MRSLLFIFASLMVMSASAQLKHSDAEVPRLQLPSARYNPQAQVQEMQMRTPGTPVLNAAPGKASNVNVWYRRPAGAFPASLIVEDGVYSGSLQSPYLHIKPFQDYTFLGFAEGVSDQATYWWDVMYWHSLEDNSGDVQDKVSVPGKDLTWRWQIETDSVPAFYVIEPDAFYYWWHPGVFGTDTSPWGQDVGISSGLRSTILSMPSTMYYWDIDILESSKTMVPKPGSYYLFTYFNGAEPYPGNVQGWWFGKNGYHYIDNPQYFIDGIAQAFEKPTAPYLLKEVVMDCAILDVTDQVDMTCKIYKLDEIPAYEDNGSASLPEEPGELIAWGRATLTPETYNTTNGLVFFTLYNEEDGLEFEVTPTIDDAILIVVDGYNDPEMANLQDFTALIATNADDDEGFGELAYLKFGTPDGDGGVDYVWTGLNNFFSSGTMKTGFTIFINVDKPYLTFNFSAEDGEYTFPREGGIMEKSFGDFTTRSIEFWSWEPSADDAWWITSDGDDVPDWLTIELTDDEIDGEFSGLVYAEVYADPLPEGIDYREAVVRFEYPGAYLDYKFMQGEKVIPKPICYPDVNGDGEVNIADLNYLIYLILSDQAGEANIATVNQLILYILTKQYPY